MKVELEFELGLDANETWPDTRLNCRPKVVKRVKSNVVTDGRTDRWTTDGRTYRLFRQMKMNEDVKG